MMCAYQKTAIPYCSIKNDFQQYDHAGKSRPCNGISMLQNHPMLFQWAIFFYQTYEKKEELKKNLIQANIGAFFVVRSIYFGVIVGIFAHFKYKKTVAILLIKQQVFFGTFFFIYSLFLQASQRYRRYFKKSFF